ncbi:MAG: polyribonucleotide nucleotidyltransferase [Planctomycetes bacterium]|nr:polyribonucleotide nucleotidyltransferase [Planctomycetota bacterium]NUQ33917.1 polyribonucleotide nucleotidyltransferase [Planctomycetaceae bacterium]
MSQLKPDQLRKSVAVDVGGRAMIFETGWLAKQVSGSALVRYDQSAVLVTCESADPRPGIDFFPLTVEYREKTGAAGKIPGGFFKREGRPTTKEILTCRLTDRPLRPMFPEGYNDEVQIIGTVLSADKQHDPDISAINGASMAVVLAGLPFSGPIGAVRVGMRDGEVIVNPTYAERENTDLDMVVAGTKDAIVMVEAGANELSEDKIVNALELAHHVIREICAAQLKLRDMVGVKPAEFTPPEKIPADVAKACEPYYAAFKKAVKIKGKHERKDALKAAKQAAIDALLKEPGDNATPKQLKDFAARTASVKAVMSDFAHKAVRDTIVEDNVRIDGRKMNEIRPIHCEIQPFPRTHGSAIFTRGETQGYVNCTLGTAEDTQMIDGLTETREERFLLHYNFPPFSTGEVKMMRSAGRREIGHGALAERALRPMLPPESEFPYTIRITSEILESNGSSSMATVCGGSLSLFDAGVPMKKAVAGIAMGLVKEGSTIRILSDILGDEDHCGDMDFKVCGTDKGITALQMDIKIDGLSREIMETALNQAREGRLHILKVMSDALPAPRSEISPYAPRYETCRVPTDKIGMVIGPGGKNIRGLQERTNSTITIEDDGTIKIFSEEGEGAIAAKEEIMSMTEEVKEGQVFEGTISSIKEFGVFADIKPGTEGMCHVSELSDQYVDNPYDVVELGQKMKFKVINVDPVSGKIKLSAKAIIFEERGEEYVPPAPRAPRGRDGGGRGGRGGDRGGRGGPRRRD